MPTRPERSEASGGYIKKTNTFILKIDLVKKIKLSFEILETCIESCHCTQFFLLHDK